MRELMTWFLNQVMDETEQQSCAGRYVRGKVRRVHRNRYRERTLSTRHGLLKLSKPQLREFPFRTKVFEAHSRVENALTSVIMESYLQGVATRDVRSVVEQLGVEHIAIHTAVHQFLDRPIEDEIAFLIVDVSYFKVRGGARYVSKALYGRHWKDEGYSSWAPIEFILTFLFSHGHHVDVGAYFSNIEMLRYETNPVTYLKDYHLRSRKEGHHGYRKERLSLQRRLRVRGLRNVDIFLTRNLCTILAVALNRLQHGVKEHLSSVAYLK